MKQYNRTILYEASAVKEVLQLLEITESYKNLDIRYINNGRYAIVLGAEGYDNIVITLKKAWFNMFSEFFQGEVGVGDTLNQEDIRIFARNKVKTIYIMFQKGQIYKISFLKFMEKAHFRGPNMEGKATYSINTKWYKLIN